MKTNRRILLLVIVFLIQIAVAFSLIVKREITLAKGTEYKFKTALVDPADPFRGRYVALGFEDTNLEVKNSEKFFEESYSRNLYVVLKKDSNGFAVYDHVTFEKPKNLDYIKVEHWYPEEGNKINFTLPFDRYYVKEKFAKTSEELYAKYVEKSYLTVKLRDGFFVADQLYINDKKLEDYFH